MYVIGEKKIKGIYEVVSDPYVEETEIFHGKIYPNRVKLKAVKITEKGISILELVPKLEIFKRKDNKWVWGIAKRAMIELTKDDFEIIRRKLESV